MEIFIVQQWDNQKKRWKDIERFKNRAAAEAKAAAMSGKVRIAEAYRSTITI